MILKRIEKFNSMIQTKIMMYQRKYNDVSATALFKFNSGHIVKDTSQM